MRKLTRRTARDTHIDDAHSFHETQIQRFVSDRSAYLVVQPALVRVRDLVLLIDTITKIHQNMEKEYIEVPHQPQETANKK